MARFHFTTYVNCPTDHCPLFLSYLIGVMIFLQIYEYLLYHFLFVIIFFLQFITNTYFVE